ncbi:MAG: DUF1501 domain-containing protein [Phycisphaerae bacterium]|nr:DUF1501 domain-containing protein [Phycisphaerae bacterium]
MPRHPTTSSACPGFQSLAPTRRTLLRAGGLGVLGLNVPTLLRAASKTTGSAPPPRARSVIFLFQFGGPSHIDMFDMKPDAPDAYRGPYHPISTSADGIQITERLPNLARVMDKVTLIRSVHHKMNNHNSASYYALTGAAPPTDDQRLRDSLDLYPAYGSVIDRLSPVASELPTFVSYPYVIGDGSRTPGQHASFLGKTHDPLFIPHEPHRPDFRLPELSLPDHLDLDRLRHRRGLQQLIDRQSHLLDHSAEARGLDAYYEKALAMLNSTRVRRAFDLTAEPADLRDRYGRTAYGQGCLLARRLAESGVKIVTCYFSKSIGGRKPEPGWDTHGFDNTRMFPIIEKFHLPITDQTLPALLEDLEQRGMLDETLVVWMGEFGRTPKINKNISRDHWPGCYTVLLAGGGVKRGFVYGSSDKHAEKPRDHPVRPDDIAATIYYLLGIDPHTEVYDTQDRPRPIANGQPILDVIA